MHNYDDFVQKLRADGRNRVIEEMLESGEFRSSAGDMQLLLESPAWCDIETQVQMYIQGGYDKMDEAGDIEQFLALQSEIRAAKQFLIMPHLIKSEMKKQQKERQE